MGDRCLTCGHWTDEGHQMLRDRAKENPTWYKDITKFKQPISVLIEDIRTEIAIQRGKLEDITRAHGWEERLDHVKGTLTSALVALAYSNDEIKKWENRNA